MEPAGAGQEMPIRVVSWNVRFAAPMRARLQAGFLVSLRPDLVLLQEVNAASLATYRETSGLEWLVSSRAMPLADLEPKRRPGAAIGGRGLTLIRPEPLLPNAPLPERILRAVVQVAGTQVTVASYYAPPGVNFGYQKVENALAFLDWLRNLAGPTLVGADANSPKIDHPEFSKTRSWWHTGMRNLGGRPGDDGLWGPNMTHALRDALRLWLENHPTAFDAIRTARPLGPLATSHWTGKRRLSPDSGTARRYDAIWVTDDFAVREIAYREDCMPEYSDHAAVVADLTLTT